LAFNGLTAKNLDLRGNPLRQLSYKSFTSLSLSEDMYINDMNFTTIPTHALYSVAAKNLHIGNGGIDTIKEEAFYDVVISKNM